MALTNFKPYQPPYNRNRDIYLLHKTRLSGFFEVDLKEGLSVRVDSLAGVAAKVLKVQGSDDQVTARTVTNNLKLG